MSQSNEACGVKSAATRKYLTLDHLWYFPPGDAIAAMAAWCTRRGLPTDRPYFTLDGVNPPSASAWDRMRAKWNHVHGLTNVWSEPPVHGGERLKAAGSTTAVAHANQKPLKLMARQIVASTDAGDAIWEPFGGLCSASVAAIGLKRRAFTAEVNFDYFRLASSRIEAVEMAPCHASGLRRLAAWKPSRLSSIGLNPSRRSSTSGAGASWLAPKPRPSDVAAYQRLRGRSE